MAIISEDSKEWIGKYWWVLILIGLGLAISSKGLFR